jgi:hypothetical protein
MNHIGDVMVNVFVSSAVDRGPSPCRVNQIGKQLTKYQLN